MASAAPVFSIEAYDRAAAAARAIMIRKALARGTDNLDRQGADGVAVRLVEDKGSRIVRYLRARQAARHLEEMALPVPEQLQAQLGADACDDCLDAINYAIILAVYMEVDK